MRVPPRWSEALLSVTRDARRRPVAVPATVVVVGLAVQVSVLVLFAAKMWFVGDDWDYLMSRGTIPGESSGWFAPHGDHWSTGVVLVYRSLFAVFGMRDYLPYGLVVIVEHVLICLVLFALLRRIGAGRWISVAATWLVVFAGAGAEAMLWDTPMNLLASVLLGLGAVLLLVSRGAFGKALAGVWLLLVLGLMFSGTGVTMVFFCAAVTLLRWGWRAAARVVSVPALAYLVWFAVIGHTGSTGVLENKWVYLELPHFVWTGMSKALGDAAGIPGLAPLALAVLLATPFLVRGVPPALRQVASAGVLAAMFQMSVSAASIRLLLGPDWAASGRYAYLTLVFLAPSSAVLATVVVRALARPRWVAVVMAMAALLFYALNGIQLEHEYYLGHRSNSVKGPDRLLAIIGSVEDGEKILTSSPGNWLDGALDPELVATPQVKAALPSREATAQTRIEVEQDYFLAVRAAPEGLPAPTDVELALGFTGRPDPSPGCHRYTAAARTPVIEVPTGEGVELSVTSDSSKVMTQLLRGDAEPLPRVWHVEPGEVHIATTAKDARLLITFDHAGEYSVCHG